VGHVRDPAIQYIVANDVYQPRSIYFWNAYSSVADLISDFVEDYSTALGRAQALDQKILSDSSAISSNYAGVVALSVRQAFGALELTSSKNSDGSWNIYDILMFLKEISSDGVGDMSWSRVTTLLGFVIHDFSLLLSAYFTSHSA